MKVVSIQKMQKCPSFVSFAAEAVVEKGEIFCASIKIAPFLVDWVGLLQFLVGLNVSNRVCVFSSSCRRVVSYFCDIIANC